MSGRPKSKNYQPVASDSSGGAGTSVPNPSRAAALWYDDDESSTDRGSLTGASSSYSAMPELGHVVHEDRSTRDAMHKALEAVFPDMMIFTDKPDDASGRLDKRVADEQAFNLVVFDRRSLAYAEKVREVAPDAKLILASKGRGAQKLGYPVWDLSDRSAIESSLRTVCSEVELLTQGDLSPGTP